MAKAANQQAKDQLKAFRKAARERGADATDEQFQETLRRIAKAKPSAKRGKRDSDRNGKD